MKFIFIGNPGTGKSTLLNGIIGEVKFKSGNAFGQGMTTRLQLEQDERTEYWYCDTPGLSDVILRNRAAGEITKALRSGDDDYKILFVVTEEAGRVRPADVTTMTCVLDAIAQEGGLANPPYGIIVNKITKRNKLRLLTDPDARNAFIACLNSDKYVTPFIHLYEKVPDLEDEDDRLHKVSQDLMKFLDVLPPIWIKPEEVRDVRVDEYKAMMEETEQKVHALLVDKAELEKQMKEDEERLNQQVEESRKEIEEKLKEKDRQMEQQREEIETVKKEGLDSSNDLRNLQEEGSEERRELEVAKLVLENMKDLLSGKNVFEAIKDIVLPIALQFVSKGGVSV